MKLFLLSILAIGVLSPASVGAVAACPTTFKCKEQRGSRSYLITLDPNTGRVWLDVDGNTFQFETELVRHERWQQGWRRWPSNFDRLGNANSWTELNVQTGALRDITNVGNEDVRIYPVGTCEMRTR